MFKNYKLKSFIGYVFISAIVYLIPVAIFIQKETFAAIWLLYLGNAFFLISILAFIIIYKKPFNKNTGKLFMLTNGLIVTVMSIILICLLITLIIFIIKPSFFPVSVQKNITDTPANANGSAFSLYINAIIGNFIAGSFASVMTSFIFSKSYYKQSAN